MARVLTRIGFEVILETDADKKQMVDALRRFGRKLVRSEIGLFHYAEYR